MTTKNQIKKIKTLQSKLGIPDDEYRLMLSEYWINSCTQFSEKEAGEFIKKLEAMAIGKGVWKTIRNKYDDLGNREGMASPRQLRMIEASWRDVSFTHDPHKRDIALRKFILRIATVDDLVFLTSKGAQKVIKALTEMKGKAWHGKARHGQPGHGKAGQGKGGGGIPPQYYKDRVYGGI